MSYACCRGPRAKKVDHPNKLTSHVGEGTASSDLRLKQATKEARD